MKRFVPLFAIGLIFSAVLPALAYRNQEVLGTSTQLSEAVFPAVTAGPGHLLPDSPFYFLDKAYQEMRLILVFTPENRAELHTRIALERLAELRVEASRNNQKGVDVALVELEHESLAAASDVRDAANQGKDVVQLARTIHQSLADNRAILNEVRAQVPDSAFAQKLAAASDVLRDARVIAQDALPQGDLEHEIAANIDQEVDEAVLGVATQTEKLEKKLSIYEKYASKAAERASQKQQEDAIRASASAKQKELIAAREKAIQDYLAKAEALRKQREAELTQLKKTIKDLQEQLKQLRATQNNDLKNVRNGNSSTSSGTKVTPTPKVTTSVVQ